MRIGRGWRDAPWIDRMRAIWLFSECSPDELQFIDTLCTEVVVTEGRTLLREGDVTTQFVVIARGTAVAAVDRRPIALIEAGSFFGDMALFGRGVQRATVTSATPMEVLTFSRKESTLLFDASIPSVQGKIVEVLAWRRQALAEHSLESREALALDQLGELPALQRVAIRRARRTGTDPARPTMNRLPRGPLRWEGLGASAPILGGHSTRRWRPPCPRKHPT